MNLRYVLVGHLLFLAGFVSFVVPEIPYFLYGALIAGVLTVGYGLVSREKASPWTAETKAGFGWALAVVDVFIGSVWAMVVYRNPALLVIPILLYLGFLAWVNRVK